MRHYPPINLAQPPVISYNIAAGAVLSVVPYPEGIDGGACGHLLRALHESIAILCAVEYPMAEIFGGTTEGEGADTGMEKQACNTAVMMTEPGSANCCKVEGAPNMWTNIIPHVTDPSPIKKPWDMTQPLTPDMMKTAPEPQKQLDQFERGPGGAEPSPMR